MILSESISDFLDNAFCISISQDSKEFATKVFQGSFGIIPHFFEGFRDKNQPSVYNCQLSHAAIIKMAKSLDLPFVTIFEDDAYPRIDIVPRLAELLHHVPDDAKIIVWGYLNIRRGVTEYDEYFDRLSGYANGSHFYTVLKSGYDDYLRVYDENATIVADRYANELKPYAYVPKENLAIQYREQASPIHGHVGYVTSGCHGAPPVGFPWIDVLTGGDTRMIESELAEFVSSVRPERFLPRCVDTCTLLTYCVGSKQTMSNWWPRIEPAIIQAFRTCGLLPTVIIASEEIPELIQFEDQFPNVHILTTNSNPRTILNEYPAFKLSYAFNTPYVLTIHYDGFPLQSDLPFFVAQGLDYIGAPARTNNGLFMNGGFSLRSHRLCYDINTNGYDRFAIPEDVGVVKWCEQSNGKFRIDYDIASRFAEGWFENVTEQAPTTLPFGFHSFKYGWPALIKRYGRDRMLSALQTCDSVKSAVFVCPTRDNFGFIDWWRRSGSHVKLIVMSNVAWNDTDYGEVANEWGCDILESKECWDHPLCVYSFKHYGNNRQTEAWVAKLFLFQHIVDYCSKNGIRYALWLDDDVVVRRPVDFVMNRFIASGCPIGIAATDKVDRRGSLFDAGFVFFDIQTIGDLLNKSEQYMSEDAISSKHFEEWAITQAIQQERIPYHRMHQRIEYLDSRVANLNNIKYQSVEEGAPATFYHAQDNGAINYWRRR